MRFFPISLWLLSQEENAVQPVSILEITHISNRNRIQNYSHFESKSKSKLLTFRIEIEIRNLFAGRRNRPFGHWSGLSKAFGTRTGTWCRTELWKCKHVPGETRFLEAGVNGVLTIGNCRCLQNWQ